MSLYPQISVSAILEKSLRLLCASIAVTFSEHVEETQNIANIDDEASTITGLAMTTYIEALIDILMAIDKMWASVIDSCERINNLPEKIMVFDLSFNQNIRLCVETCW